MQTVPQSTLQKLSIERVADLYEGLTDCLSNFDNAHTYKIINGKRIVNSQNIQSLANAYQGRLLLHFYKLSHFAVPDDPVMDQAIHRAIHSFFAKGPQEKEIGYFQNLCNQLYKNPKLVYQSKFEKEFEKSVSKLGSRFASGIIGKEVFTPAVCLPYKEGDTDADMQSLNEQNKVIIVTEKMEAIFRQPPNTELFTQLVCHEYTHNAFNHLLKTKENTPYFRIINISRRFNVIMDVARTNPSILSVRDTYYSLAEERRAYDIGDQFLLAYNQKFLQTPTYSQIQYNSIFTP